MERCIHKHLYNFVISNKMLTFFQSRFIKDDSSFNQLACVYNDVKKALGEGKQVLLRCIKSVRRRRSLASRSHSHAMIHRYQWLPSSLVLLLSFRTQRTGSFIQLCLNIPNYQRWCSSKLYHWTFTLSHLH